MRPIGTSGELGAAIKERRIALGCTQARVAADANVSRQWLSALEHGKRSAEVGLVFAVLDALRLTVRLDEADPTGPSVLDDLVGEGPHDR